MAFATAFTTVTINTKKYVLAGLVREYLVPQQAQAIRIGGKQTIAANPHLTQLPFSDFSGGFGAARWDLESERGFRFFRNSTIETRWIEAVVLAILDEASTEVVADEVVRGSVENGGDLWSLWEDSTTGFFKVGAVRARKYTGSTTTWGGGGALERDDVANTANEVVGLDIQSPGSLLIALAAGRFKDTGGSVNDINIQTSPDGVTWTSRATINLLTNVPTANENIDAGLICPTRIRGESVVALWDEDNKTVDLRSSTNDTTWTAEINTIPSQTGVKGIAVYPGIDGNDKLYVAVDKGVYEVDTSPATWTATLVLPMVSHADNGRRMIVHQRALWIPVGGDNNTPAAMWRMTVSGDARVIETDLGLDALDGVANELLGPWRWLAATGQFLFASVGGGAASRNGRVLCHNGKGWHHLYRNGTANQQVQWIAVSGNDDGTPRLHFSRRTATSESDTSFLGQPLAHPDSGVTVKRQASGSLEVPEVRLMPNQSGAAYSGIMDAAGMSAAETIAWLMDVNGTSPPTTSRGTFTSTVTRLDLNSDLGISGRTFNNQLDFARGGTNTLSPKMRSMEFQFDKNLRLLRGWQVPIDLDATAKQASLTPGAVLSNLNTVIESDQQLAFILGDAASVTIQCVNFEMSLGVDMEPGDPKGWGRRTGVASLWLEEMIP